MLQLSRSIFTADSEQDHPLKDALLVLKTTLESYALSALTSGNHHYNQRRQNLSICRELNRNSTQNARKKKNVM